MLIPATEFNYRWYASNQKIYTTSSLFLVRKFYWEKNSTFHVPNTWHGVKVKP